MNRPQNTDFYNHNSSNLRPESHRVSARAHEMRRDKRRELCRRGYAAGGTTDDEPTMGFGDLSDALDSAGDALDSGLGALPLPSRDDRAVVAESAPPRRNALSDALMQAGFAMMAASRPGTTIGESIGAGGLRGLEVYRTAQAANEQHAEAERQRRADADFAKKILSGEAGVTAPGSEDVVPSTRQGEKRVVAVPAPAGGTGPTASGPGPLVPESSSPKATNKLDGVVPDEGKQRPASRDLDDRLAYLQREYNRASTLAALAESPAQRQAATTRLNALRFEISNTRAERDRAERNNKSDIGVIGTDAFGSPVYGYRSGPKAGQPVKVDDTADTGPLQGDALLERISPQSQAYVKGIASGEIEPPKGPRGQRVIEIVRQYDPSFNSDTFAQRRSMRRGYAPEGKIGQQMSSASAALQHAEALLDAHNRMGNSNWHSVNAIMNPISRLKENPALNDFETNKLALIGEVEKYLKGGSPAESSLREMAKQISPNSTPAEIRAVLYKVAEVMSGKTKGYVSDWDRVFGKTGAELPANTLPHSMDENIRIEDLLRKEFEKTQKPNKPAQSDSRQGVTLAPPKDGDIAEKDGHRYRWNSERGKYLLIPEGE